MTTQTRWIEQRPLKGERCRRRNDAGRYCNRLIAPEQREKGWTWDAECVREHHASRRAAAKTATPKAGPRKLSAKARRDEYSPIVARLEAEGVTTSDAQAAADVEVHERGICDPKSCPLHLAAKPTRSKPPVSAGS